MEDTGLFAHDLGLVGGVFLAAHRQGVDGAVPVTRGRFRRVDSRPERNQALIQRSMRRPVQVISYNMVGSV
jgi:hypothetical protein